MSRGAGPMWGLVAGLEVGAHAASAMRRGAYGTRSSQMAMWWQIAATDTAEWKNSW